MGNTSTLHTAQAGSDRRTARQRLDKDQSPLGITAEIKAALITSGLTFEAGNDSRMLGADPYNSRMGAAAQHDLWSRPYGRR